METEGTIYLDHQATTPLEPRALEEMRPFFESRFGNPHSTEHAIGWRAHQAIEQAALDVATLVGAEPDEVIFTSGATEANNLALVGLAAGQLPKRRRRVMLSAIEHKCVLEIGRSLMSKYDLTVETIPVDSLGRVDIEGLEATISDDVLLVSVMAVNNEIGTVQDVERISKLAAGAGSYFHCDAAQAACAIDISQLADHADLISISSHKMYGPAGIGALVVRRELQSIMQPNILGGGQQNGLRSGTLPTALCVGFGAAARIAGSDESKNLRNKLARRRDDFFSLLQRLPCNIWINGPDGSGQKHPGNLNIGFENISASDLLSRLQPMLAASTGSACTSGMPEPSHVLRAIGLDEKGAASSLRFSLGKDTTLDNIQRAASLIEQAITDLIDNDLLEIN